MIRAYSLYAVIFVLIFVLAGIILVSVGINPFEGLSTLLGSSFRTSNGFWGTIKKFIPLLLMTYAFAIPLRISLYNIGGLGQMQVGGIAAMLVSFELSSLPSIIVIPVAIIAAIIAGGLYASIAAYLKNRHNINPIISTSMLTFVSNYLIYFTISLMRYGELTSGHPMTKLLPPSTTLPYLGPIPSWIIIIIIAILFYYFLIEKTITGYKIEATGVNPSAADAYGIQAKKVIYITFFIAGAFAGLAGSIEVLGVQQRLIAGFARTSGAEFATFGALSSLIAGPGAFAIPITTFILSVLLIGADSLQRTLQVPVEVVFVLQTVLVLLIVSIRWQINKRV